MNESGLEAMSEATEALEQDTISVTLPRLEAQALRDLLDGGIVPKPQSPLAIKKGPPTMVQLRSVFPGIFRALDEAIEQAAATPDA